MIIADQESRSSQLRSEGRRTHYRAAYLPASEFAAAWERGLLDATVHRSHVDYRWELEQALRHIAERPGAVVWVVPLDVAGLVAYAEREGVDPGSRRTRLDYNDSLYGAGRDIRWPPSRNGCCWCGSDRKYKQCCGAPGFLAVEPADPASLVLRVELDDVQSPVWRRIAVPSELSLDRVHELIQTAMGWQQARTYRFTGNGTTVVDPKLADLVGLAPMADSERLISLVNEIGDRVSYVCDTATDRWSHTIAVEEIRDPGGENIARVLDGTGNCPPSKDNELV